MWIISRLSFPLLYKVSDFLYYLLYYVFSYRKKVVRENLKLAFPKMNKVDRTKTNENPNTFKNVNFI